MSTTVPFGMARDLVQHTCGIEVSAKGLQEICDRRGSELLKLLQSEAHAQRPFDDAGLPSDSPPRPS